MDIQKIFSSGGDQINAVVKPIVSLVLIVAIIWGISRLVKNWKQRHVGRADVNKDNLNPAVNYDNYAARVNRAFTGFPQFDRGETAAELMSLNDDELKQVYNRYDILFGKGSKTMYSEMFDLWYAVSPNLDAIKKRMERLGLT